MKNKFTNFTKYLDYLEILNNLDSAAGKEELENLNYSLVWELNEGLKAVDQLIGNSASSNVVSIQAAINNLLQAGGKKIRALLVLISFSLCGKIQREAIDSIKEISVKAAAAIELIHNATLLHDDVVDNNSLRRGKENIKSLLGNKISILAGDFVLSIAFNLIISLKSIEAVKLLAEAAHKLSEGEIRQLELTGKLITEAQYLQIIETKTAVLFSAACALPSILVGLDPEYIRHFKNFGYNIGMAFQIIDDLLDYTGDTTTGKQIGNDFFNNKFTLPCIIAYNSAKQPEIKDFWQKTFFLPWQEIQYSEIANENLQTALQYLKESNAIELTKNIANQYIVAAEQSLSFIANFITNKEERKLYEEAFKRLAYFIINRRL